MMMLAGYHGFYLFEFACRKWTRVFWPQLLQAEEEKKEKGQKRSREEKPPPEPRAFEPFVREPGCPCRVLAVSPNSRGVHHKT